MRLINSQAKQTQKHLKEAENITLKALSQGRISGVRGELDSVLSKLPKEALKIVKELAVYEKDFTAKKLKKYTDKNITTPSDASIIKKATETKIGVSLGKPKQSVDDIYKAFANTKSKQLLQTLSDARVLKEEPEVTALKIKNLVGGLFKHQNKSIAALAIQASANIARTTVAFKNRMFVEWTADFESSNVCSFCEDMDGTIYEEETDDIPAHANCACTWTIVDGNEEEVL